MYYHSIRTRTRGTIFFSFTIWIMCAVCARARRAIEDKMGNWTLPSLSGGVCMPTIYLFIIWNIYFHRHHFFVDRVGMRYEARRFTSNGISSARAHGNRNKTNYNKTSISNYRNHLFIRYWIYVYIFLFHSDSGGAFDAQDGRHFFYKYKNFDSIRFDSYILYVIWFLLLFICTMEFAVRKVGFVGVLLLWLYHFTVPEWKWKERTIRSAMSDSLISN